MMHLTTYTKTLTYNSKSNQWLTLYFLYSVVNILQQRTFLTIIFSFSLFQFSAENSSQNCYHLIDVPHPWPVHLGHHSPWTEVWSNVVLAPRQVDPCLHLGTKKMGLEHLGGIECFWHIILSEVGLIHLFTICFVNKVQLGANPLKIFWRKWTHPLC